MSNAMGPIGAPSPEELEDLFHLKYGEQEGSGLDPAIRHKFGYYNPDDCYEALVNRFVTSSTIWLDLGCGRDVFPSNRTLARILANRCKRLVGVDPDATLEENPFVHHKVRGTLGDYNGDPFTLVTMRMVAEHVEEPFLLTEQLARCVASGGLVVIYTVNRFSPVPVLTRLVPFSLHQPIKHVLWRTDRKDTFPTRFRMNTRRTLQRILQTGGFHEVLFSKLDDCRTFARFRPLLVTELWMQRFCATLGISYPENCLLGVYQKR